MLKRIYKGGMFALVSTVCLAGAGREIEELSVYYKKETLLGTEFVYREDMAAGTRKETWTINGKTVTAQAYEDAILEAEKELRREERRVDLERRRARQEAQLDLSLELHKKILRLTVDRVETILVRCKDPRLEPLLQFGAHSELSKADFEAAQEDVVAAKKLLSSRETDTLSALKALIAKLEPLPDRLESLIQASMDHAVKYCDDTKMLKELLGLVPLG